MTDKNFTEASPEPSQSLCNIIWCQWLESHQIHVDPKIDRFHEFAAAPSSPSPQPAETSLDRAHAEDLIEELDRHGLRPAIVLKHFNLWTKARAASPHKDSPVAGKYPIDRPCSACSGGDTKMEFHDHEPPFRAGYEPVRVENEPSREAIEQILFRRALEKRLEGYTLETSEEIFSLWEARLSTEAIPPIPDALAHSSYLAHVADGICPKCLAENRAVSPEAIERIARKIVDLNMKAARTQEYEELVKTVLRGELGGGTP